MFRFGRIRLASAVAALLLIGPADLDSQAGEKTGPVYKTPQAVFDAAKKAAEKGDGKGIILLVTDDNRDSMAGLMVIVGSYTKIGAALAKTDDDKAKIKKIEDVLDKHGVTAEMAKAALVLAKEMKGKPPAESLPHLRRLLDPIKDRAGFVADMLPLIDKKGGNPFDEFKTATLKEFTVDGDVAKGSVVLAKDGAETTEPIEFRKEGGGWKIYMDMNKKK